MWVIVRYFGMYGIGAIVGILFSYFLLRTSKLGLSIHVGTLRGGSQNEDYNLMSYVWHMCRTILEVPHFLKLPHLLCNAKSGCSCKHHIS